MDIDLGSTKVFNVKINGESYKLDEPTYKDVRKISQSEDDPDAVAGLLVDLGLPMTVIEGLTIPQFTALVEKLTSSSQPEKK